MVDHWYGTPVQLRGARPRQAQGGQLAAREPA